MGTPLFVDIFEPSQAQQVLQPITGNSVVVANLNQQGYADYRWVDAHGNRRQWERKQFGEALSDLDGLEEQLNRELETCEELKLVVEGFGIPTEDGVQVYKAEPHSKHGQVWVPGYTFRKQPQLWARWLGLKWALRYGVGIEVIETVNYEHTLWEIAVAYKKSTDPAYSPTTMKRYVIPHIPPFSPNLHVENLMRLKDVGIGPERAQKLIAKYTTFWNAISAPKAELVALLGPGITSRLLDKIGRTGVW